MQSANLTMKRKLNNAHTRGGSTVDLQVTGVTMDTQSVKDFVTYDRGGIWASKAYQTPGTVNDLHV